MDLAYRAMLAALVATDEPPELRVHPTADGGRPPEAMPGGQAGPIMTLFPQRIRITKH